VRRAAFPSNPRPYGGGSEPSLCLQSRLIGNFARQRADHIYFSGDLIDTPIRVVSVPESYRFGPRTPYFFLISASQVLHTAS
jgi:hypothetical protein